MTLGAMFASLLAVVAASDGQAETFPAQAIQATSAPAGGATAVVPAAAEPNALAEAARVVLSAGAAGTPIVISPAPDRVADEAPPAAAAASDGASPPPADGAATPGDAASESPPLSAAPAGPPLSDVAPILLERIEAEDGWATERLIEPSGEIVLHTVNAAGTVQVCRTVGSLLALALVEQRPAAGGEFVHVARDASGALVSYAIGVDGEPRAVSLVAPAPR